ncbi:MAG: hypothetical protein ACYDHD_09735 [Vulcanimicrobiaceae bacterium]
MLAHLNLENIELCAGGFQDLEGRFHDLGTDAVALGDCDGHACAGTFLNGY